MRKCLCLCLLAVGSTASANVIQVTGSGSTSGLFWNFAGPGFSVQTHAPGGFFPIQTVPCAASVPCSFSFVLTTLATFSTASYDLLQAVSFTGTLTANGVLTYNDRTAYSAPISITGTLNGVNTSGSSSIAALQLFSAIISAEGTVHLANINPMPSGANLVQLDTFNVCGVATILDAEAPETSTWWLAVGPIAASLLMRRWRQRQSVKLTADATAPAVLLPHDADVAVRRG